MIKELQGLRGLLAWWVVLAHIIHLSGNIGVKNSYFIKVLSTGYFPVDVFIIMSGFVIMSLLDKQRESYYHFIFRRFFRLYPVFILCFALCVLLTYIELNNLNKVAWSDEVSWQSRIDRVISFQNNFKYHIVSHLTLLHGILPKNILPYSADAFLVPAWSISLEWQFYLIAPLVYWSIKYKNTVLLLLVLLFFFISDSNLSTFKNGNKGFLLLNESLFAIGILSYWFYKNIQQYKKGYFLILLYLTVIVFKTFTVPIAIWALTLFIITIGKNSIYSKILNSKILQKLGQISYSTYLIHWPVIIFCQYSILNYFPKNPYLSAKLQMFIGLILLVPCFTFLFSLFLYNYLEYPFIVWSKKKINENRN